MKNITQILSATASSILLSSGFSRLAEKLDPMSRQLSVRSDDLLHEADPSSVPTAFPSYAA
jgi:hypothetical protein